MEHSTEFFTSTDGRRLFERVWPPVGSPRGAVLIVHGYAEHSGRYAWAAGRLAARGYGVLAFDLRGHGHADGDRVAVRSANEYLDDVDAALARTAAAFPGLPIFMLGHSMGGAITTLYACARIPRGGLRDAVRGIILSGAVLPAPQPPPHLALLARLVIGLGRLFPNWRMRALVAADVSRDPAVVADYETDPLNYRGKMPAGLMSAMVRGTRFVERHMPEIALPLLILHGSADALTSPQGSRYLYETAGSTDKTLKIYEGLYHEILNEPEKDLVIEDIANWLDRHAALDAASPTEAAVQ